MLLIKYKRMSQPINIPNNAAKEPQATHIGLSPEERRIKTDKLLKRLDSLRLKVKNHEDIDVRKI